MPEETLPNQNLNSTQPEILPSATPTVVNKKSSKKFPIMKFGLVLILIALSLSLLGGGYYFGKQSILKQMNPGEPAPIPSKDPDFYKGTPIPGITSDWKTFESQKYNFIVKYPESISPS